jgi:hypothetical protein
MLTHDDLVACEGPHRCRGHRREGHEDPDLCELGPQVSNDGCGGLWTATRAVKNEVERGASQTLADLHHALHVFQNDRNVLLSADPHPVGVVEDRVSTSQLMKLRQVLSPESIDVGPTLRVGWHGLKFQEQLPPRRHQPMRGTLAPVAWRVVGSPKRTVPP